MRVDLSQVLPELPRIKIVDVGAMFLGTGTEAYAGLLQTVPCEVVGFEPVAAECAKLNAAGRPGHVYLPHVIGDGGEHTFHECNFAATSSLLEPNTALLEQFQNLEEITRVVRTSRVATRRLDDLPEVAKADYLKLDVQGGEALVLEGAGELLKSVLVVHTEVEFVPLYKDQPLYADIDRILRRHGFGFHRLATAGRAFKPFLRENNPNAELSQMLWGDAIFVRDFMQFDRLSPAELLKVATILNYNYESVDLAGIALRHYDRQLGTSVYDRYLRAFARPSPAPA